MAQPATNSESRLSPINRVVSALILVVATILVVCAMQQAIASFLFLPVSRIADDIQKLKAVPVSDLDALIVAEESSLAVKEDPRRWSSLSLAMFLRGAGENGPLRNPTNYTAWAGQARQASQSSLALAPANPYDWMRLTWLAEQDPNSNDKALAFWRLAKATGPNEPTLRVIRTQLALPLWQQMSDREHADVFEDVLNAWPSWFNEDAEKFVELSADPFMRAIVRSALLPDLEKLKEFEKRLANRFGRKYR